MKLCNRSCSWEQTINKHYGKSTGNLIATCCKYENNLPTFCLHSVWHVSWRWECDLSTSCLAPQKWWSMSLVLCIIGLEDSNINSSCELPLVTWTKNLKVAGMSWIPIRIFPDFCCSAFSFPRLWRPLRRRWPRCESFSPKGKLRLESTAGGEEEIGIGLALFLEIIPKNFPDVWK